MTPPRTDGGRRPKVLSDFDGVWTDPAREGAEVQAEMVRSAAALLGIPRAEAESDFAAFAAEIDRSPGDYGWFSGGRITAYCDEDPFCRPNGIAGRIHRAEGPLEARYREAILGGGHRSLNAFADACFFAAMDRLRAEHPPAMVPGAREQFEAIAATGAEIVVVSNSGPEKLTEWFGSIGLEAGDGPGQRVRIVGSAKKFVLGEGDESLEVAGRTVLVDRPHYRAILEAERPDVVIGDVFSLDLALPHRLRLLDPERGPARLVLRQHPYTPDWVAETRAGGAIDRIVDSVGELADVVNELTGDL